jgi:predicted O-methyltransferase YrrM
MSALDRAQPVLDDLHQRARGDWKHMTPFVPYFLLSKLTGKSFMKMVAPSRMKQLFIPVSRDQGRFLYLLARSTQAKQLVEFGASFGISTLYLAAAARDNGGTLTTTEIEPDKCRAVEEHLRRAGLDGVTRVLEGDAMETLRQFDAPIDLLFLDGWKDLYLPVLELLLPRLRPGALILADNTDFPEVRPYLERVRQPDFVSTPLPKAHMECSYFTQTAV